MVERHALSFFSVVSLAVFLTDQADRPHRLEAELILKIVLQLCNRDSHLLHGIAIPDSHCTVCLRVKVVGYAERSSDLVLSSVSLSDVSSVVKLAVVILGEFCINLLCALV